MKLPRSKWGLIALVSLVVATWMVLIAVAYVSHKQQQDTSRDNIILLDKYAEQSEILDGILLENDQLSKQMQDIQSKMDAVTEENNKRKQTNESLQSDNKSLQSDIDSLRSTNRALLDKIKKLEEQSKSYKSASGNASRNNGNNVSSSVSRGNKSNGKTIMVEATAYTAYCNGCSGTTKTGINLRANPGLKVIAVDPKVIPLGTKVYVEGYGNAVAGDTGGAIKGHKVDLFMSSKSKAYEWGRRTVALTILN